MHTKEITAARVIEQDSVDATDQHSQGIEEDEMGGELSDRGVALRPTPVELREPDAQLLAIQVGGSVNTYPMTNGRQREIMECAVASYAALDARDAIESLIGRLMVAASNASMDSFSRAAQSGHTVARDLNLKYGIKAALAVVELTKALDQHRGRHRQTVSVGQVNIQSGGQAVVGNVAPTSPVSGSEG